MHASKGRCRVSTVREQVVMFFTVGVIASIGSVVAHGQTATVSSTTTTTVTATAAAPTAVATTIPPLPVKNPPTYYSASGYTIDASTPTLTVKYNLARLGATPYFQITGGAWGGTGNFIIDWTSPLGVANCPIDVKVSGTFGKIKRPYSYTFHNIRPNAKGQFEILPADLNAFGADLIQKINGGQSGFDDNHPVTLDNPYFDVTVTPQVGAVPAPPAGGAPVVPFMVNQPVKLSPPVQVIITPG